MVDYYVGMLPAPDALRGSFGWYRAFDATVAQNEERKSRRLAMPVLAIGGETSYGDHVGEAMQIVADDVQSVVIPGTGHWVAEDAPDEMLAGADRVPVPVPRRTGRGAGPDAGRPRLARPSAGTARARPALPGRACRAANARNAPVGRPRVHP